ncbi:hypothetical protein WMY93_033122 [Mugilogobius chulae]|uniref:YqaJ viral recombinase domain-containing protein n=1 Tax=Mugilogobius chulae TaxID=88201 RepID=A0AAW0ML39_9GOBI
MTPSKAMVPRRSIVQAGQSPFYGAVIGLDSFNHPYVVQEVDLNWQPTDDLDAPYDVGDPLRERKCGVWKSSLLWSTPLNIKLFWVQMRKTLEVLGWSRDRRLPDLPDTDEPIITRADLEVANSLDTLDLISPSSWCGPIEYSLELPEDPIDWDAVGRSHNDNAETPLMPPGSDTTGTDAETPLPLMDTAQMFQFGPEYISAVPSTSYTLQEELGMGFKIAKKSLDEAHLLSGCDFRPRQAAIELRTPRDFRLSVGHFGSNMNSATGSSTAETFKPSEYTSHFNSHDIDLYIKKLNSIWQHYTGKQEEVAVTSKKCKWAIPSEECLKKVEYQQCKDIIFNNSKQNKKDKSSKDRPGLPAFPPLTAAEQDQLYHNLSQCRTQEGQIIKPVVLSVIREYAASYIPKAVMLDLPQPLTSLYDKQARDLNLAVLQDRAEALFENITVTKEQSDIVEEETRAQSKSKIWFEQRSGRVTGSTFRAATKTDIRKPAVSLIRQICYPKSHSFTSEATRWGCKHEDMVRNYYEMQHRLSHADVVVGPAGFRISPLHPFIGASPDGYVSCSCCGSELFAKCFLHQNQQHLLMTVNDSGATAESQKQGTCLSVHQVFVQ